MAANDGADVLARVAAVIETRKGADPNASYVASLLAAPDDRVLAKIGEEATETLLAAKEGDKIHLVAEVADLWFHCLVLLARHDLGPADVLRELARREGVSGHVEKASRGSSDLRLQQGARTIPMTSDSNCIFCKIVRGEVPSRKLYEDADIVAFHDIQPWAPVHFMLVPKKHIATLYDVTPDDSPVMGKILTLAGRLAREQGAGDGFRTIINTGRVGRQDVKHVHVHVLGGPEPLGPMLARPAKSG